MATLDKAVRIWRQVKRVLSLGLFGAGVYLLWLLYTGDLQGPVMMFFGVLLTGGGFVGSLFPSKVKFFEGDGDDAY
ncbi:hypothetical protein [Halosimplex amylolyticum]|uniref:hypothetical protein n=1 Tax=Halosimplex amylolyticum TaxID=3396616 RepID=UPI003F5550D3